MKALSKIVLALTAVAALSIACPAKANLITNSGFEAGVSGWTFTTPGSLGVGAGAHSGSAFGNMPFSGGFTPAIAQSVATTAGATYTISFFVASAVSSQSNLRVSFGGTVFNHLFAFGNNGYTQLSFTATASGANTNLAFSVTSGVATFRLDDVSVNAVGAVPDGGATVSLLGCALLGLAALRRRVGY